MMSKNKKLQQEVNDLRLVLSRQEAHSRGPQIIKEEAAERTILETEEERGEDFLGTKVMGMSLTLLNRHRRKVFTDTSSRALAKILRNCHPFFCNSCLASQ